MPQFFQPEKISLLNHPEINEKWVQDRIAENPSILGLGDLVLKDKERIQPAAGRLDILLQDPNTDRRYEVEIQLGKTDESHIIRTIEYWDSEKNRYPQYDHCAVIIAEDITSRFLNVINLFNGAIPLIALKMEAYKYDDKVSLIFTTVLDERRLGLVDEDEEVYEATDRNYWISRGTEETVKMADEVLEIIKEFATRLELKYNKFYIGMADNGQPNNFSVFRPRKGALNIELKLPYSEETQKIIENAGMDDIGYNKRWGVFRIRLLKADLHKNKEILKDLLLKAYNNSK